MKIQIFVKSPKCFPHPDDVFEIPAFFRMTIKMQEQLDQNDGPLDVVKNLEKTSRWMLAECFANSSCNDLNILLFQVLTFLYWMVKEKWHF